MKKETGRRRLVEVDPSIGSLEVFVDSLFEAKSEHIRVLVTHRSLNTHWFDLRLGDRRLKLLPTSCRLLLGDGTETDVLWNDQEKKWKVVGLTKILQDRKVKIKRANGDMTITVRPTDDDLFWIRDIVDRFKEGIVKLDDVQRPLEGQRVEPNFLGGMIQIEIDGDSLTFYSRLADADELFPETLYCLYLRKDDPLAKGLCEPMTQLLGQFFWLMKKK